MTRFDTHLCLVSAQPTPNLAPALDPDFKPRRVVLAVSKDMGARASGLADILKRHGVAVEHLPIDDPYDFYGCSDRILSWLSEQPEHTALNVTGGTKVMAMAAQDVFRSDGKPVFYINIDRDEVVFIDRREASFTLPGKIRLREFLEAHGYSLPAKPTRPDIPANRRDFVARLVGESERLGNALGRLNGLAQEARGTLVSPELTSRDQDSRALGELISWFKAEALLSEKEGKLHFPGESARQFVNGGWLEFAVYTALSELAPELAIADYTIGLEVIAPDGKTKNELDACFLHRNTLHIVECKAANLALSGKTAESRATEALYKLETLRDIGGLRTKALLIDFRGGLTLHDQQRARQLRIKILSGRQLRNLRNELRGWIT